MEGMGLIYTCFLCNCLLYTLATQEGGSFAALCLTLPPVFAYLPSTVETGVVRN